MKKETKWITSLNKMKSELNENVKGLLRLAGKAKGWIKNGLIFVSFLSACKIVINCRDEGFFAEFGAAVFLWTRQKV